MDTNETRWREGLQYKLDKTLDNEKYQFEWSAWLSEISSETLSNVSTDITVEQGLVASDIEVSDTAVTAIFSCAAGAGAPEVGAVLKATCVAGTNGGQSKARSIYFKVVDKQ